MARAGLMEINLARKNMPKGLYGLEIYEINRIGKFQRSWKGGYLSPGNMQESLKGWLIMKYLKTLFMIAALFQTAGCNYLTMPLKAPPPANLTAKISEPEGLESPLNMGELLQFCIDEIERRKQCMARYNALINWSKR